MKVQPGETITAINGEPVWPADKANAPWDQRDNYWKLDRAVANSDGKAIELTVKGVDGKERPEKLTPHFVQIFSTTELVNFGGMVPRVALSSLSPESPARGQIIPGDVVEAIADVRTGGLQEGSVAQGIKGRPERGRRAGQPGHSHARPGPAKPIRVKPSRLCPIWTWATTGMALGVPLGIDEQSTVVSEVLPGSPAEKAGVQQSWRITKVAGQPVSNWFQVRRLFAQAKAGQLVAMEAMANKDATVPVSFQMTLGQDAIDAAKFQTFTNDLLPVPARAHRHTPGQQPALCRQDGPC